MMRNFFASFSLKLGQQGKNLVLWPEGKVYLKLNELSEVFMSRYFYNHKHKKDMATLFAVRTRKEKVGERLKVLYEWFLAEQAQIYGCTSEDATMAFHEGLLPNKQVYKDLVRWLAKDMGEIQTQIEGEIMLEEIAHDECNCVSWASKFNEIWDRRPC